jgi:predicted transcriptional regulator
MRILTEIPDEDIQKLEALAAKEKRSRAAAIRDAVRLYLAQNDESDLSWITRGAGYWKGRIDIGEGVDYQRALREDRTPYDEL